MATYFIHKVDKLGQEFVDRLVSELGDVFVDSIYDPDGLSNNFESCLSYIPNAYSEIFIVTIDNIPVSVIYGILDKETMHFYIHGIYSTTHNGNRDYLYQKEYFEICNNKFIELGYTGKTITTLKKWRDDNWIRRACTEHPIAEPFVPTITDTEHTTIWSWSFS